MTGIQPSALLADEDLWTAAVEQAGHAEWSSLHELVAQNIEVTHTLLRVTMIAHGAKRGDIPDPLQIPRPGSVDEPPGRVLSGLEAALTIAGGG